MKFKAENKIEENDYNDIELESDYNLNDIKSEKLDDQSPNTCSQSILENSSRKKSRKSSKNLIKSYKQRQFDEDCIDELNNADDSDTVNYAPQNHNEIADDESVNNSFQNNDNEVYNEENETETNDSQIE